MERNSCSPKRANANQDNELNTGDYQDIKSLPDALTIEQRLVHANSYINTLQFNAGKVRDLINELRKMMAWIRKFERRK